MITGEERQETEKNYVPLTIEELLRVVKVRKPARDTYTGHRTGKGRYTKPTMTKEERRKKRKETKKHRKANRK